MEYTTVYRLWQAPFLQRKFEPLIKHNQLAETNRVLDVGCGPGTNTQFFRDQDYLGIDINPAYIEYARRKFGRSFEVADATQLQVKSEDAFDLVLMNSLLHHIADEDVSSMLDQLSRVVSADGHIHIIDLVLPPQRGIPRYLALNDRGDFSRPLERWKTLFEQSFTTVVLEPFEIRMCGVPLWNLVYFKGKPRQ